MEILEYGYMGVATFLFAAILWMHHKHMDDDRKLFEDILDVAEKNAACNAGVAKTLEFLADEIAEVRKCLEKRE